MHFTTVSMIFSSISWSFTVTPDTDCSWESCRPKADAPAEWGGFCVGGKKPPTFPDVLKISILWYDIKKPMQKTTTKMPHYTVIFEHTLRGFSSLQLPTNGWWLGFLATIFTPSRKGFDESLSFTDSNLWLQQWKFLGFGTQRRTSRSALMVKTKTKKKGHLFFIQPLVAKVSGKQK